jgi:hypothetical protein
MAMSEYPIAITQYNGHMIVAYMNKVWSIGINVRHGLNSICYKDFTKDEGWTYKRLELPRKFRRDLIELRNKMMVNKYLVAWDISHITIMNIDEILYGEHSAVHPKAYATYEGFDTIGIVYYRDGEGAIIEDVIQAGPNSIALGMTCVNKLSDKRFARIVFIDIENGDILHTDKAIQDVDVKKLTMYDGKIMAICAKLADKTSRRDDFGSYKQFELYVIDPATALVVSKKKLDDE